MQNIYLFIFHDCRHCLYSLRFRHDLYRIELKYPTLKRSYVGLSLTLLKINKIIDENPKNITIPSIILDEVKNERILPSRAFEVPKTKPNIIENNDRLMLFPTSLLVDNIVDASDKSFCSTIVKTKRLFGDENNPCPIP